MGPKREVLQNSYADDPRNRTQPIQCRNVERFNERAPSSVQQIEVQRNGRAFPRSFSLGEACG
jgi:hypothetical protein